MTTTAAGAHAPYTHHAPPSDHGGGLPNAEITQELVISVATAKTNVTRLLARLDARDRVQLVIIAHETGLVTP